MITNKSNKKKVRLIKLLDNKFNNNHPNNINEGFIIEGVLDNEIKIGESVWLNNMTWATSTVNEIIDKNTFKTLNSTYKIEYLSNDNKINNQI